MNNSSLHLGQYIPIHSISHSLDARSKLMSVAALGVSLITAPDGLRLLAVCLLVLALVRSSRIRLSAYLKDIRLLLILVVATALLQMVATPGEPWLDSGWFAITREGRTAGLQMLVRLLGVILLGHWLVVTTRPVEMTAGLHRLLSPLERLHFPVHELVMIMTLSLRFLSLLVEETLRIQRAQLVRGADWSRGSIRQRIERITSFIVPVVRLSLERAVDLAEAMENRGYRGGHGMTRPSPHPLQARDYLLLILGGAMLVWQWMG